MPKATSEKCRLCAKLSAAEAISLHGDSGTGCWDGDKCHKRRTYYRNRDRYNRAKRQQYRVATGKEPVVVSVQPPQVMFAVLQLYRTRVDAPLHAVGAELWRGDTQVAVVEPVHTLGWKPAQVQVYLRDILKAFSTHVPGAALDKFETQQELSPSLCPVLPCPLHK